MTTQRAACALGDGGGDRSPVGPLSVWDRVDGVPRPLCFECLQEMIDISKKMAPCFENFSRLQQISDIQTEIYQNNLEIELLQLDKDTADLIHPSYLVEKCDALQSMNNHLEAVLREKQAIRQRLLRSTCEKNLPLEAVYHRYMVNLLELAVSFIEKLETHLETIKNIPHLGANLKNMCWGFRHVPPYLAR
ncbi:HAUS augmin-like complex subunit 2 isoform X3 [Meriones unguiculatus]|uniref:HAUS augmin-like complex subunit 2 isoform X3 n=1 Tax=Meriones unguiculatus TaxID=10047 RepID=UPI00293E8ADC|nr:HAUS augmin-like complex subunit 2 isoform X3 [Meriones unguiculatus]